MYYVSFCSSILFQCLPFTQVRSVSFSAAFSTCAYLSAAFYHRASHFRVYRVLLYEQHHFATMYLTTSFTLLLYE